MPKASEGTMGSSAEEGDKQVLIRLRPEFHRLARQIAAQEDVTLRQFVENAVVEALERARSQGAIEQLEKDFAALADTNSALDGRGR